MFGKIFVSNKEGVMQYSQDEPPPFSQLKGD